MPEIGGGRQLKHTNLTPRCFGLGTLCTRTVEYILLEVTEVVPVRQAYLNLQHPYGGNGWFTRSKSMASLCATCGTLGFESRCRTPTYT
jgi:hypothetical protein